MVHVLVVEDEPQMRAVLVDALENEGYRTEAVGDGLAALLALRSRRFDAAAVDVALPGMSGVELCRHVRREELEVGIVLVTARDGLEDRILGLDSGADDYLVKPFALAELTARIRARASRCRRERRDRIPRVHPFFESSNPRGAGVRPIAAEAWTPPVRTTRGTRCRPPLACDPQLPRARAARTRS